MNTRSRSNRFPVLQDAQTTSHSRNTALLRGLARVYHLRLGQFSRDERIADGVLCKLGDWEDMVETDPEIMACVFEAQKVIMEATLARPPRHPPAGGLVLPAPNLSQTHSCSRGFELPAPDGRKRAGGVAGRVSGARPRLRKRPRGGASGGDSASSRPHW